MVSGSYCQLSGPKPGDVYREFALNLKSGNNWRVTDPNASASGAHDFLPNPIMTIQIEDLDGAVRAEALMDIWGGHTGTIDKKFRFNGNTWIDIPDHPSIPVSPECYNSEFNYITEVPLGHLQVGNNQFEGNSGGQTCFNFNWGQWGYGRLLVEEMVSNDQVSTWNGTDSKGLPVPHGLYIYSIEIDGSIVTGKIMKQ